MQTAHTIGIHPAELAQVVNSVFATMLKLECTRSAVPWFNSADRLTAAVHLAGAWTGAVLLECDRAQACRLAGRFLSMDPPEAVDDVVRDLLGELANMFGGNLKCVLTGGLQLSMPTVTDGCDYRLRVCGAEVLDQLAFESLEGPFWVTILTPKAQHTSRQN